MKRLISLLLMLTLLPCAALAETLEERLAPFQEADYERLTPDEIPEGEITVAAWILTHPHIDHYGAFSDYMKRHGNDKSIKIEAVMFNLANTNYYNIKTSERTENCTSDVEAIRKTVNNRTNKNRVCQHFVFFFSFIILGDIRFHISGEIFFFLTKISSFNLFLA